MSEGCPICSTSQKNGKICNECKEIPSNKKYVEFEEGINNLINTMKENKQRIIELEKKIEGLTKRNK